ncbi:hypothetical protein EVG20_g7114 [Dentipellis fragilis]|uniref:CxC6 like cysteine cluster associated with KDZ domain-containing protein n=1 Tax=Dentipellis fragilis TaxID=205917 RepID=A0A4Y9YG07_9AGAM|nr:hypothetical protein EVG20_g7114 [Dentipellis fragilis]
MERNGAERRSALFQLKKRLEQHGLSYVESEADPLVSGSRDEVDEADEAEGQCEGKAKEGNTKPRARFGRRWTHNEQLCVATCGVILGRMTMYGSEAVHGATIFLHCLFPTTCSLPRIIFYDNACQLKRHLFAINDHHFDLCALPVDVFHMNSKHKISDEFCGLHCNPARFPELCENGRWRFNSSAAEMTNAWFKGFRSLVREMREDRYDFLLDEMIKQKNRLTVAELARRGAAPRTIDPQWFLCVQSVGSHPSAHMPAPQSPSSGSHKSVSPEVGEDNPALVVCAPPPPEFPFVFRYSFAGSHGLQGDVQAKPSNLWRDVLNGACERARADPKMCWLFCKGRQVHLDQPLRNHVQEGETVWILDQEEVCDTFYHPAPQTNNENIGLVWRLFGDSCKLFYSKVNTRATWGGACSQFAHDYGFHFSQLQFNFQGRNIVMEEKVEDYDAIHGHAVSVFLK